MAITALLGQQLVACSSQVSATESERLAAWWNALQRKQPIYVLEITEAGNKRKFSSDINHCKNGDRYTAYVPTRAMAQLVQVMVSAQAHWFATWPEQRLPGLPGRQPQRQVARVKCRVSTHPPGAPCAPQPQGHPL